MRLSKLLSSRRRMSSLFIVLFLSIPSFFLQAQQWRVYAQTDTGTPIRFSFNFISKEKLAVDKNNRVWMSLSGRPSMHYSPMTKVWEEFSQLTAIVFADMEGNIYFRNAGKTFGYDGETPVELFDDQGYDYDTDSQGNIWYSSVGKTVVGRYNGIELDTFDVEPMAGLYLALPFQVERDIDDIIWNLNFNTFDSSTLVQVNGPVRYNASHADIFNYAVLSMEVMANNNIWVGTFPFDKPGKGTALLNRQTDTWTMYNNGNSLLPSDTVQYLKGDHLDRIWISTARGLARFDGTDWKLFNTSNSPMPSDTVISIAIDTVGTKWFATENALVSFNEIDSDFAAEHCGLSVTFADQSASTEGDIISRRWDFAGIGSSEEASATFTFPAPGNYDVWLWVRDETGNRNIIMRTIEVNDFTQGLDLGPDINTCAASVPLASNIPGADSYLWTTPEGMASGAAINAGVSGEYILELSSQGCVQKDTVQVLLNSFTPGNFRMTAGGIELPDQGTVLTEVHIHFENTTGTGEDFTWDFGDAHTSTDSTIEHQYATDGERTVLLTGSDERGCPIIVTKTLLVRDVRITNAITSNGDGLNDKLYIDPMLYDAELKVINRWGQSVFESNHYRDDFTGEGLASGVYFYEVYFKSVDKRYKGYVHILK